jgi:hypothetical protein
MQKGIGAKMVIPSIAEDRTKFKQLNKSNCL